MDRPIHPNAIVSSNLLRLSALLCMPGYYYFTARGSNSIIWGVLITIMLLLVSAYLVRNGYNWIRWVMVVIVLPGIILIPFIMPAILKDGLIDGLFSILQSAIQAIATILLFIPYKMPENIPEDMIGVTSK